MSNGPEGAGASTQALQLEDVRPRQLRPAAPRVLHGVDRLSSMNTMQERKSASPNVRKSPPIVKDDELVCLLSVLTRISQGYQPGNLWLKEDAPHESLSTVAELAVREAGQPTEAGRRRPSTKLVYHSGFCAGHGQRICRSYGRGNAKESILTNHTGTTAQRNRS